MTALLIGGFGLACFGFGFGAGILVECWFDKHVRGDCDLGAEADSMTSDPVDISAATEAQLAIAKRNILAALEEKEPGRWLKKGNQ